MRNRFIALAIFGVLLLAVPAAAQDATILIQIDGIVRGAEGEIFEVTVQAVDPALVGARCTAGTAQTEAGGSEHPDNDFIIASGGTSAEIMDFEAVSGTTVAMSGAIALGESITVSLRLGPNGVSSGGFVITLTCTPPGRFIDDGLSIFEADIEWMADQGITKGCNPPLNDRFCPSDPVTRGEMAAFLVRGLDLTDRQDNPFRDDDGSIFEADIERLAAAGITSGCNPPANDRFCPDRPVTRGEMAALLVRALDYTDDGGGDLFLDDNDSIFENHIDRLATAGVTKGCNPPANDRYCPDHVAPRGQMGAFLHRALA